eukprot:CAMPEP_0174713194 /NCGR_PEP_ID=MMETSP1094-20130205/13954_1 /TAXON_ID=156173 /ORGANISM="Chrysochromulina brevifilum, Strain UTEX LB 985" /LENGTH=48 /DNA_ID= /DNA_START= /DNA_END= /DNA_ORIENTATION=
MHSSPVSLSEHEFPPQHSKHMHDDWSANSMPCPLHLSRELSPMADADA